MKFRVCVVRAAVLGTANPALVVDCDINEQGRIAGSQREDRIYRRR